MIPSIVISLITCIAIVVVSIVKPSIKIKRFTLNFYWVIALIGALVILLTNLLSFKEFFNGLISNEGINPLQILILFISMTIISIFLDEVGFFEHVANWVIKHTKAKQMSLFLSFYLLVSILTMFTSNDIIILTLTPFIIFFSKRANISPIPYLVGEFVAANTWSMMFVIGNPTNIYLASSYNITFIEYFKVMALPTLAAGLIELFILVQLFYKKLKEPINPEFKELEKEDIPYTVIGLTILIICTVFLIISSYINLPMYLISFISCLTLIVAILFTALVRRKKPIELGKTMLRAPYELIPFVISMFALVLALNKYEVTNKICELFGTNNTIFKYGFASMLSANLLNNIPMSVVFSSILSGLEGSALQGAIYASIMGSNIGAFLTPIGALAGIMWMGILKNHGIKYSFLDFIKYGFIIALPTISVGLLVLYLIF